jgi:hypothetical protein
MKISTQCWHYKYLTRNTFNLFPEFEPSNSLCKYFWQIPVKIVMDVAFSLACVVVATPIALLPVGMISMFFTDSELLSGFGVAGWMFTIFVGCTYLLFFLQEKISEVGEKLANREGDLLPSYIKAKKDKVCPRIDFE